MYYIKVPILVAWMCAQLITIMHCIIKINANHVFLLKLHIHNLLVVINVSEFDISVDKVSAENWRTPFYTYLLGDFTNV